MCVQAHVFLSAFLREVIPVVGPTERHGRLLDVLAQIPASNGTRDGSDSGLIPDIDLHVYRAASF